MSEHDLWLKRFRPCPQPRARLVCLPHGGGSAVSYRAWAKAAPAWLDLVAVQYPGRMERAAEPYIDAMAPMADAVAAAVARRLTGPIALSGHSMGAAIAFETALRLERRHGRTPLVLFVSGRKAPSRHRRTERHLAPEDEMFAYLRYLGGADAPVLDEPAVRSLLLPTLRSDFKLSETWSPPLRTRLSCPLVALGGDRDPEAPVLAVSDWDEATQAEFRLRVFSGGHFYLHAHEDEVIEEVMNTVALYAGDAGSRERADERSATIATSGVG